MKYLTSKKRKIFFIIILFITIIICVTGIIILKKAKSDFKLKDSRKEIGYTYVLKSQINNIQYNLRYPFFKYDKMDSVVYQEIQKQIENFTKKNKESADKTKIQSDFNDYGFNNNYGVSIDLRFLEKSHNKKQQTIKTLVFCYGKKLQAKSIFVQDKIKNIVSKIKNEIRSNQKFAAHLKDKSVNLDEKIPNNISSLENFIIKKSSIAFLFNSGSILPEKFGVISVEFPNSALRDSLTKTYFKINPKEDKSKNNAQQTNKNSLIALTFDDGPAKDSTNEILDELEKNDAHATFFVVGKNAKQFPDILKRQIANGHEIGNHTFSHPTLTKLNVNGIKSEVEKTEKIVEKATDFLPKLVRAPGGSLNQQVKNVVNKPFIHWSVDPKDWQTRDTQKTIELVLKNAADGDIVLMHDIYPATAKAVKKIVPELINRGFSLVTVSEMFDMKNIPLEPKQQYSKAVLLN